MESLWDSIREMTRMSSEPVYDDELKCLLLRCKQYKDVNDMIVKQAKLYHQSLTELSSVGRAAGETYVSISNFRRFVPSEGILNSGGGGGVAVRSRRSSSALAGPRGRSNSSGGSGSRDVRALAAMANVSTHLYPPEERQMLVQLGRAERAAHQVQAVFAERISAPIVLEGKRFKERYDELRRLKAQYKRARAQYFDAQHKLDAERAKRVPSMEAQVKLVTKLATLEEEFDNATEKLFVHARALEEEHMYAMSQHVCGFLIHHYNALVSALRVLKRVVPAAERYIPEKIHIEAAAEDAGEAERLPPRGPLPRHSPDDGHGRERRSSGAAPKSLPSEELLQRLQRQKEARHVPKTEVQRLQEMHMRAQREIQALRNQNERLCEELLHRSATYTDTVTDGSIR
ncbi:hypothetical protein CDCA_CDCA17G4356 [Cyanidium caldarium]|uniref:BAR domain-containing protein n=1 Tax=Cyanidium caldarium TaxID=2771 RepID=A0AAV9J223_CYACA|nr:hypothetical protein CDCA_CDCA17G4356 [Cyanidium caldarium]